MPFKVCDVQQTPNPNALKFVLDGEISSATVSFFRAEQAAGHPLAEKLFAVAGVSGVLLLRDFVTISKQAGTQWRSITPKVRKILEAQ